MTTYNINIKYKGSIPYHIIENNNDITQLNNIKHYTKIALNIHIEQKNISQIKFFRSELRHINKKIKTLSK